VSGTSESLREQETDHQVHHKPSGDDQPEDVVGGHDLPIPWAMARRRRKTTRTRLTKRRSVMIAAGSEAGNARRPAKADAPKGDPWVRPDGKGGIRSRVYVT
jgi:hypothetical protein